MVVEGMPCRLRPCCAGKPIACHGWLPLMHNVPRRWLWCPHSPIWWRKTCAVRAPAQCAFSRILSRSTHRVRQVVVSKVRLSLQPLMQRQFTAHLKLNRGNPNLENLKVDFRRFGFTLDLAAASPTNPAHLQNLTALNRWRNVAAHHGVIPAGTPPLILSSLQAWRLSCDRLANSLDVILYNELRRLLKRALVTASEDTTMPPKNDAMPFKLGDHVKIRRSELRGRIVELAVLSVRAE